MSDPWLNYDLEDPLCLYGEDAVWEPTYTVRPAGDHAGPRLGDWEVWDHAESKAVVVCGTREEADFFLARLERMLLGD